MVEKTDSSKSAVLWVAYLDLLGKVYLLAAQLALVTVVVKEIYPVV